MLRHLVHLLVRSVRGRLALLVAALVVPVVALAGTLIAQAYRNERDSVASTLLSTARAVSRVVESEIEKSDILLKTFAASYGIARDDFVALDDSARRALADDSRWLVIVDLDGRQLLNTRLPIAATRPRVEFEPELLAAMERGQLYLSNLRRSRSTGEQVIHVSRPYFRDGKLKYILTITILPRTLAHSFEMQRYAPSHIVTIVDRRGTILARSRNADRYVGGSATPDMVESITKHHEGVVDSVTLEHIPVLTAFSHATYGWATLIGAPRSELYISARRLLVRGVVGSSVLIVVAIGMAAWIGRAVVRGVDVLGSQAETLGRGAPLGHVSTDLNETDFVAESMRRTAAALQRRTRTLEVLNRINTALVAERDIGRIVKNVTDAACELCEAQFGVFLYLAEDESGRNTVVHTICGNPPDRFRQPDAFARDPLFQLNFPDDAVVRHSDLSLSSRRPPSSEAEAATNAMRSFLAVPVRSRTGEIVAGIYLGHAEPGIFTAEAEAVAQGLAAEAAIAMDNAKLYHALARELDAKSHAEAELRRAQERLREYARDLERKVEERTASLQDAVTQMEEFSYTVSHDLRSPLRAMYAFAEALAEEYGNRLDDTARDYLQRIQRASRRMDQLTTDLLSYSRVARAHVQLQPTDVESVVLGLIEHYTDLQPSTADVVIESPLAPVLAHPPSLTQCLANLLTNATKFVRAGERARVTIRTEQRGARVRIWVEDRGIGISPEAQAKLFRIFERGPNSVAYEGTGVGLAIVRKATEKMGGSYGVESDGNSGSRFWIELSAPG